MASPSQVREDESRQLVPAASLQNEDEIPHDIPRRLMRVKILYTFDDQNKSNCLARLPNALNIPTVSLDQATQVGVIELKTCIQAIVAASPELVAKLGHDYTVYAYDYSEYETPLVGQGMLSWILASASTTPNAPAEQSQTMVTGRVCKNILGLFSNGIKETLEVKLKLIPVPTCMQKEYVESMERYHNLSQVIPEGFDYNAWADFLRGNPAIGQLTQSSTQMAPKSAHNSPTGGVESFHQMLTRPLRAEDDLRNDRYREQAQACSAQGTRASSPAMSAASYNPYNAFQDSRPNSRASSRSDVPTYSQQDPYMTGMAQGQQCQQPGEEGPPKKRARVTRAKRPKKTVLTANDSLRVTASTAASVRLHRPVPTNSIAAVASIEQVPRAPTPRPGEAALRQRHSLARPPPSLLRHASIDGVRPYVSPYDSAVFSDNAVDSADDERGPSPGETPMDIPSSPPVMPQRLASSAPSSPGLPTLPLPADSGFVSDMALGQEEENTGNANRPWDGSDLPTASDTRIRKKQDRSHHPWAEVMPGPMELLPESYVPKPRTGPRQRQVHSVAEKLQKVAEEDAQGSRTNEAPPTQAPRVGHPTDELPQAQPELSNHATNGLKIEAQGQNNTALRSNYDASAATDSFCLDETQDAQLVDSVQSQNSTIDVASSTAPEISGSMAEGNDQSQRSARSSTPHQSSRRSKSTKSRGLPRSQTWSGEPMSDAAGPAEGNSRNPRSGAGAKRKQNIVDKMHASIAAGDLPTYCHSCGEIETPTWRNSYSRVEEGPPDDVKVTSDKNGIYGIEVLKATEDENGPQQYRIFKQSITKEEEHSGAFTKLTLCNPCGLWLIKKGVPRPRELWEKARNAAANEKGKRKRNPQKGARKRMKDSAEDIRSDAPVPHSEPVIPGSTNYFPARTDGCEDDGAHPSFRPRTASFQTTIDPPISIGNANAAAALQRAFQSSPPGFIGSKKSPIDVEPDLTPKPTRRLLFPSPRKIGESKSLDNCPPILSPTERAWKPTQPIVRRSQPDADGVDKENCPPPTNRADDDLAHLFEEHISPKTTPTKGSALLQDLLKTPTPGSSRGAALTPKRSSETSADLNALGLITPSRAIMMTPKRSGRAATVAPETPFTAQLNALLSDAIQSSPSQVMDLSVFPSFNTPGRGHATGMQFSEWMNDDFLSSDMPMPSSPPGGLGFSLYEDPETCTVGLWSGPSIFEDSDAVTTDAHTPTGEQSGSANVDKTAGVSLDFAAMINDVVRSGSASKSPEGKALGATKPTSVETSTAEAA